MPFVEKVAKVGKAEPLYVRHGTLRSFTVLLTGSEILGK